MPESYEIIRESWCRDFPLTQCQNWLIDVGISMSINEIQKYYNLMQLEMDYHVFISELADTHDIEIFQLGQFGCWVGKAKELINGIH